MKLGNTKQSYLKIVNVRGQKCLEMEKTKDILHYLHKNHRPHLVTKLHNPTKDYQFKFKKLIYKNKVVENYFVLDNGDILSKPNCLRGWFLTPSISGVTKYPSIKLRIGKVTKTISVHRIVCETYKKKPDKYPGVSKKDWAVTPKSVKEILLQNLQVNHIDGNPTNYHPSNLEWVTPVQNIKHYHTKIRKNVNRKI